MKDIRLFISHVKEIRSNRKGDGELGLTGRVSIWEEEEVLEADGGDGCMTR